MEKGKDEKEPAAAEKLSAGFFVPVGEKKEWQEARESTDKPHTGVGEGWKRHGSFSSMKLKENYPHNTHKVIHIMRRKI